MCCGTIFVGQNQDICIDQSLMHPCRSCHKVQSGPNTEPQAASPAKSNQSELPSEEAMNDADEANDADSELDEIEMEEDLDDIDDLDDDDMMAEMDGDLMSCSDGNLMGRVDDEDEGTDSGVGSQEMSTAEHSPHPAPSSFQTAAAMMLHAMSTGADLSQSSLSSDEKTPTASPARNSSTEQSSSSSTTPRSPLHSTLSSVAASQPPSIQMKMGY